MTLFEVDEAANRIREEVDPEANIIFGSTFDEKLEGRMRISVVATGIDVATTAHAAPDRQPRQRPRPSSRSRRAFAGSAPSAAAAAALEAPAEPTPAVAQAIETAAVREGAFIAPRAVEPAVARPPAAAAAVTPDPYAAAAMENGGRPAPAKKARGPSLFERVTGVGRSRPAEPERPQQRTAPTAQPQQPRLGALDPGDRLVGSKTEEDLLDIPAFLRRQAN